jgi:hypothetical protein
MPGLLAISPGSGFDLSLVARTQLLIAVGAINLVAAIIAGRLDPQYPDRVIAEHLHVRYKTVANTCTQLKAKLGVRTLPELMRIAIQHLPAVVTKAPRDR